MWFYAALALAVVAGIGAPGTAVAQDYPSRQVTIVVPFAAGNQSDTLARMIGAAWSKRLGQPVVILNKPGATGMLGTDYVAKLPADGYTIQIGTNSTTPADMDTGGATLEASGASNALANRGNAQSAGAIGAGNAWQNAISNGIGLWQYQKQSGQPSGLNIGGDIFGGNFLGNS